MALNPRLAFKTAHNWIGLGSAVFLLALLVTGVLLNHPMKFIPGAETRVLCLAADPARPDRLYRGTVSALEVSGDGGGTWEEVPMAYPPLEAVAIAFQPGKPRTMAVLQKWHGPILSEDGGVIWSPVDMPFDPLASGVELEALSFGADGAMYLQTSQGALVSRGGEWTPLDFDPARRNWTRIVKTLHNGHFFGEWFVKVYDVSALALLLLIVTGIVLWRVKAS